MDEIVDDLIRVAQRCERAAAVFDEEPIRSNIKRLLAVIEDVAKAWSGSWIGYHARTYIAQLQPRQPGEFFDSEMGADRYSDSIGDWVEYDDKSVLDEILRRAGLPESYLFEEAKKTERAFDEGKVEVITTVEALLANAEDKALRGSLETVQKMASHVSATSIVNGLGPRQVMSRDSRATQEGIRTPPHISVQAYLMERSSYGSRVRGLAQHARRIAMYLQKVKKMKGASVMKKGGAVFIGHGGISRTWKDLRDLLEKRMGQTVEEFNTQPVAGKSNKERLLELLDTCTFAFLVMTAEDEQKDGPPRARQNVIHEVGLFQGRYGWLRAIVMLEEGCERFSNIEGIGYIPFPKGKIEAASEEIRRVLEREEIL